MSRKKVYCLVQADNNGNYDANSVYGMFDTKEEAEAKLNEYKTKYGTTYGFSIKEFNINSSKGGI